LVRGAGDGEERPHAKLLHVLALEHLDLQLELATEFFRLLGEVARRADVGRKIAERAREIGAVGRGASLGERLRELRGGWQRQHDALQARRGGFLLLQLVETIERLAHAEDGLAQVPAERPALYLEVDE